MLSKELEITQKERDDLKVLYDTAIERALLAERELGHVKTLLATEKWRVDELNGKLNFRDIQFDSSKETIKALSERNESLNKELIAISEQLAELKALPPFSWGLADKDGNAYLSECCIGDEGCMIDEAEAYNYELEPEHHIHAVPLFTASKPAENDIAKFMAGVKSSMAQGVAEAIQKEALQIMFDEIIPDTETVAMQYESLVKKINRMEDEC